MKERKPKVANCKWFLSVLHTVYCLLFSVFGFRFSVFGDILKSPGTAGVPFLKIGFSARPAALAGAFAALSDDITSLEYNVSGIAALKATQFAFTHLVWFEDISGYSFLMSIPAEGNVFGLNAAMLQAKDFVRTLNIPVDETKPAEIVPGDEIELTDYAISICYARKFLLGEELQNELKLGFAPKFITEKLYTKENSAFAVDFGLTFLLARSRTVFGISVQNLGDRIRPEDILPLTLRAGIAQHTDGFNYGLDITQSIDSKLKVSLGLELILGKAFTLRLGTFFQQAFNLTAGLGFDFKTIRIDYAYLPHADLGSTHRISIIIKFKEEL